MPGDSLDRNEWFSRDPKLYATASGLPPDRVAPYIIDAKFDPSLPGGLPQGGETIVDFPNSHLQYAITWFGLAARPRRRLRCLRPEPPARAREERGVVGWRVATSLGALSPSPRMTVVGMARAGPLNGRLRKYLSPLAGPGA